MSGPEACRGAPTVKIGPGEMHVTTEPEMTISTVLGSCVSACIRDPVALVGGMNHFMLPQSETGMWSGGGGESGHLRYGNFAMARLVEAVLAHGGRRERLEAKLFGAARMGHDPGAVGAGNARFAVEYLAGLGIRALAVDMGGTQARRLVYHPASGRAFVSVLPDADPIDANRE